MKFAKKSENYNYILILAMAFLLFCGIIIGAIASAYISTDTAQEVTNSASNLNAQMSNEKSFFKCLFFAAKYPIIIFIFSFSIIGVFVIPLIILAKGFFLSFSIGSFMKLFGIAGIGISVSSFAINSLIIIPCTIVISALSLSASYKQKYIFSNKRRVISNSVFSKGHFITCGIVVILLCVTATLDFFISPYIVNLFI